MTLEDEPQGDCYEASADYVLNLYLEFPDHNIILCHGMVMPVGGPLKDVYYGHAWLEFQDLVLDVSNGRKILMRQSLFYEAGRIDKNSVVRYTARACITKIHQHQHYGPWHIDVAQLEEIEQAQLRRRLQSNANLEEAR